MSKLTLFVLSFIFTVNVFGKTVYVKGYCRKNGTYVRPHTRNTSGYSTCDDYEYEDARPKLKILKECFVVTQEGKIWHVIWFKDKTGTIQKRWLTEEQSSNLYYKYNVTHQYIEKQIDNQIKQIKRIKRK